MANRYLRASGNWNGSVWAATSGGAAGSAGTPSASDDVYIQGGHTVTINQNVTVEWLGVRHGTINNTSYDVTINGGATFGESLYNQAVTINMGSGTWTLNFGTPENEYYNQSFSVEGSATTVNAGTSTLIVNDYSYDSTLILDSTTFNDCMINLYGDGRLKLMGSPRFRLLDIRSGDGATRAVNFNTDSIILDKFIAIGSSSANKLILTGYPQLGPYTFIQFTQGGTSYGQYVDARGVEPFGYQMIELPPAYIGSNSVQGSGQGWLLQDPSKTSTLVDPLTTAPGSNPNWTVSGTVTQVTTGKDGGGYQLASGAGLLSTDTYDLLSSTLNFQTLASTSLKFNTWGYSHSLVANKFYRLSLTGTTYLFQSSDDGTSWTNVTSSTVDPNNYRSMRVGFAGAGVLGTINTSFNQPPTTTLNSPAASGTVSEVRPHLDFTGIDADSDTITYQLQLNTTDNFTSPLLNALSASDTGFTNRSDVKTDPFYSGNQIRYTLQSDLARGSDYYWRVRGRDTNGTGTWGNWTAARKFTVAAIPATVTITGVSDILDISLKVSGSITGNGGATVTERGAVLSTSPNPTTSDLKFTATGESFTAEATGLTASTTYYVRTYAINTAGTSYSVESTIMTLQPQTPPTVEVGDPVRLLDTTTQLTANVTLDGTKDVTERGIVFSTEPNPDTDDNKVTATSAGLGEYTLPLTGLLPETTYYYRAYAINEYGTGYSAEKSFTTLSSFVPDEGDGYWVFSVTGSDAIVARSQATPAHSSVSLPLADLNLEGGKTYTLSVGDFVSELGDPKVTLVFYGYTDPLPILIESGEYLLTETDENIELEQPEPINSIDIPANSNFTFTYDTVRYHTYVLQLHVTGDDPVAEELTATFKDLYLAEESTFSEFVPFTPYGLFEIKLENNQIVEKRRQDVIQSMFDRIEGWEVTPFEVTTEGLGYFEIGDGITIKDDQDNDVKSYLTEYTLTLDGGISEKLIGKRPAESETDYSKAGNIKKLISNTTLQVDKQRQEIEALVQDVTGEGGYIDEKFTQVFQDISQVRTTVQGAGGVNLIRNSVMYAYNNLGYPEEWTTTHVDGEGSTIVIQGSAESKAAGGLSGHIFTLNGTKVVQRVTVRKDADFITEENKTFYTFNIKVKKDLVGVAYVKLSNRQEEHIIDLPNGESYLWEDFSIEGLLPKDDHYDIEIYSDADAEAQFTDAMLSVGEYTHSWTQAPGEAMNMVRSDTVDGTYWRSPQLRYNYTHISPLGMNVHKRIRGQEEEVFGFNADETNMSKVKATKQVSMGKIRVVPIEMNGTSGWAWAGAEE